RTHLHNIPGIPAHHPKLSCPSCNRPTAHASSAADFGFGFGLRQTCAARVPWRSSDTSPRGCKTCPLTPIQSRLLPLPGCSNRVSASRGIAASPAASPQSGIAQTVPAKQRDPATPIAVSVHPFVLSEGQGLHNESRRYCPGQSVERSEPLIRG